MFLSKQFYVMTFFLYHCEYDEVRINAGLNSKTKKFFSPLKPVQGASAYDSIEDVYEDQPHGLEIPVLSAIKTDKNKCLASGQRWSERQERLMMVEKRRAINLLKAFFQVSKHGGRDPLIAHHHCQPL